MEEKGKEAGWKEISCLEEKLILTVPGNWERIAAERVNRLFPYVHQPQEVMGDGEEEKLFTLNLLSKGLEEGQVNGAIREIQRAIQRVHPESCRQGIKRRRLKAGVAGWFSFSTGGEEREKLHYLFILSFQGEMLLGSYHFPAKEEPEEAGVFQQILQKMRSGDEDTAEVKKQ